MRIPRFWAKATGSATEPTGKQYRLDLWGWSNESAAEALATARRRLADLTARITRGELGRPYPYGERPLREEIVRTIAAGTEGEAVVTRNRYGALVLNTARVPFVDVDVDEVGGLQRLLGRFGRKPLRTPEAVLEHIRETCRRHDRHSFRIYRTKAGFRVLATDLTLDPTSARTRDLLSAFGADPRFIQLCGVQEGFRARLTPKPWRCGCRLPPGQHPREDPETRERFAAWLEAYEATCERYAACRYLETIGRDHQPAAARTVIQEHDRTSRADSELPLA